MMNNLIIDCVAILIGDYSVERKQAAILLLKHYLPDNIYKAIISNNAVYPISRDDIRVKKWKKKVLKRGKCEKCNSTKNLEAHHIIKWADYPQGRCDLKNGMCLCHKCHTEEHKHDASFHMMKAKK